MGKYILCRNTIHEREVCLRQNFSPNRFVFKQNLIKEIILYNLLENLVNIYLLKSVFKLNHNGIPLNELSLLDKWVEYAYHTNLKLL